MLFMGKDKIGHPPNTIFPKNTVGLHLNTGFAGLLDTFLCGTYLTKIFGLNDPESIEYGIARAQRIVHGACKVYGTLYALNHKDNIADAVYVCLSQSEGLMVFDIVQVIEFNQWAAIKEGIQRAESL